MKVFIFYFLLISVGLCDISAQYFPNKTWKRKPAIEVNMSDPVLDSAVRMAFAFENKVEKDLRIANLKSYASEPGYQILGPMKHRGGPAGIVIKDGYIVKEWGDVDRVDMTFSVTKSVLAMMAGLAFDKGLIASLDDKVGKYIWDGTFDGTHNGKITWHNLLQQNSDWSGCQYGVCDWSDRPPKTGEAKDWELRKLIEPGTVMEYNDARVNVLSYALTHVLRKPMAAVLREEVMDPIEASTTWRWYGYDNAFTNIDGRMVQVASGGGHFGGGLFISTTDMARFGLLMLNDGVWNGKRIFSSSFIKSALTPSKPNETYGYLWWLNTDGNMKSVPKNVYAAHGFGGNYIVIDPNNKLVIVTRWLDTNYLDDLVATVISSIKK